MRTDARECPAKQGLGGSVDVQYVERLCRRLF